MFYARETHRVSDLPNAHDEAPFVRTLRDVFSDALEYWETRRLVYNIVLAIAVAAHLAVFWRGAGFAFGFGDVVWLFVLGVLANICYCAAYLADIFVQLSRFRDQWRTWRWLLFAVGIAFAAIIAFVISSLFFRLPGAD